MGGVEGGAVVPGAAGEWRKTDSTKIFYDRQAQK